jgi:hypothetical protein
MTKQSRGRDYADLLIMSPEHYAAYDAATVAIQRQTERDLARQAGLLGARIYRWRQARRDRARRRHRFEHARQHHVRSQHRHFRLRYHPNRNFDKLFDGDGQMPIDKDAIAQFIGWMGELTHDQPAVQLALLRQQPCGLIGDPRNKTGPTLAEAAAIHGGFFQPEAEGRPCLSTRRRRSLSMFKHHAVKNDAKSKRWPPDL